MICSSTVATAADGCVCSDEEDDEDMDDADISNSLGLLCLAER